MAVGPTQLCRLTRVTSYWPGLDVCSHFRPRRTANVALHDHHHQQRHRHHHSGDGVLRRRAQHARASLVDRASSATQRPITLLDGLPRDGSVRLHTLAWDCRFEPDFSSRARWHPIVALACRAFSPHPQPLRLGASVGGSSSGVGQSAVVWNWQRQEAAGAGVGSGSHVFHQSFLSATVGMDSNAVRSSNSSSTGGHGGSRDRVVVLVSGGIESSAILYQLAKTPKPPPPPPAPLFPMGTSSLPFSSGVFSTSSCSSPSSSASSTTSAVASSHESSSDSLATASGTQVHKGNVELESKVSSRGVVESAVSSSSSSSSRGSGRPRSGSRVQRIVPLFVDYGQRGAAQERHSCKSLCEQLGLELSMLDLSQVGQQFRHLQGPVRLHVPVPHRNLLLLSTAASFAAQVEATSLVVGLIKDDMGKYSSSSLSFVSAFRALLASLTPPLTLACPLSHMTKAQVVSFANGALNLPFELTYSCMRAGPTNCGSCSQCVKRREAFERAGVVDPCSTSAQSH